MGIFIRNLTNYGATPLSPQQTRKHYGDRARYGTKPEHARRAAGKNIRFCMQQLEEAGLVGTTKFYSSEGSTITMGKALTKKGIMDMDRIAAQTVQKKKK